MQLIKRAFLTTLLLPGVELLAKSAMRARATIFMMHRFRDEARGVEGSDPEKLRRALAWLRRRRYPLVPLQELFERLADGTLQSRAVSFTIDDGYLDHATIAAPVFAEFDCPVTVFLTSGFIDGSLWFWWDRIAHVFQHTPRRALQLEIGGEQVQYAWTGAEERDRARFDFVERCKRVSDVEKHEAIDRLAGDADVGLPMLAPPRYAPMSWDQARSLESGGMSFGPHTVTHPVLSHATDAQAEMEIAQSWRRVSEEVSAPTPVFCYPNGGQTDFGLREVEACRAAGLIGAVVGTSGHAAANLTAGSNGLFEVPRFHMPDDLSLVIQYVSGVERIKTIMRDAGHG